MSEVDAAFEAALAKDAGKTAPAEVPPPPRQERDPEAPHGRAEDGSPLAPYGLKADGVPRIKPAGPGAPKRDEKPRVVTTAPPGGKPAAVRDYTSELMGLGTAVWLGASSVRGGRLGPVRLPDMRPYAAVWHQQLPQLAGAWNAAAQQNATVRGYVEQLTGEGSKTWLIGVAISGASLVGACIELAKAGPEIRAQAAAANDAAMQEFVGAQVQAMGMAA